MAILRNDNFSLEIAYRWFDAGWVNYDIWCRWREVPVLNPAILRNDIPQPPHRAGVIEAQDYEECGLLPVLREAINSDKSDVWFPLHPAVAVAVYANGVSPLLPQEFEASILRRRQATLARVPKQTNVQACSARRIEILVLVDTFNFRHADAYSGEGIGFTLSVTPAQLQRFYNDLRAEYAAFRQTNDVDTYLRNRGNTER